MSPTKSAVVFTKNNARILKYNSLEDLKDFHNVVISADLTYVAGVPPHFWRMADGVIREMTEDEKVKRIEDINSNNGPENDIRVSQIVAYESKLAKEMQAAKDKDAAVASQIKGLADSHAELQQIASRKHDINVASIATLSADISDLSDVVEVSNKITDNRIAKLTRINLMMQVSQIVALILLAVKILH